MDKKTKYWQDKRMNDIPQFKKIGSVPLTEEEKERADKDMDDILRKYGVIK